MTDEELTDSIKSEIDSMSREAMASQWRFAPIGHPWFQPGPVYDYWKARFDLLGGMSPGISKAIGW